jgi:hypothetical protein
MHDNSGHGGKIKTTCRGKKKQIQSVGPEKNRPNNTQRNIADCGIMGYDSFQSRSGKTEDHSSHFHRRENLRGLYQMNMSFAKPHESTKLTLEGKNASKHTVYFTFDLLLPKNNWQVGLPNFYIVTVH